MVVSAVSSSPQYRQFELSVSQKVGDPRAREKLRQIVAQFLMTYSHPPGHIWIESPGPN